MPALQRAEGTRRLLAGLLLASLLAMQAVPVTVAPGAVYVKGESVDDAYAVALGLGLFGRFVERDLLLDGDLVDVALAAEGGLGPVRLQDATILERFDVPVQPRNLTLDGPLARFGDNGSWFEVHDNRYAWIRFDGVVQEARLSFPAGSELVAGPDGISAVVGSRTVQVQYDGEGRNNVTMEGTTARIRPQQTSLNLTISLAPGIHHPDVQAGAWSLIAASGDSFVADVLQPGRLGHRPLAIDDDGLTLHLEPIPADLGRDAAHRIETVGVFPTPPRLFLSDERGNLFQPMNASEVFSGTRSVAWTNATLRDNTTIVRMRQPFGLAGDVRLEQDGVAPRIEEVVFLNTTGQWSPTERPPTMVVHMDEPTSATSLFDSGGRRHVVRQSAYAETIRLDLGDLLPDTDYEWSLTVRDRAGNVATANGTLSTPADVSRFQPMVTIHEPAEGARIAAGETVVVRATVHDGRGDPLPPSHIRVLVDGRNRTAITDWDRTELTVPLGLMEDGPHRVEIHAAGHDPERATTGDVSFVVAGSATTPFPAGPLWLLVLALVVRAHRGAARPSR